MEKRSLLTEAGPQPASVVSEVQIFPTDGQHALDMAGYELGWRHGMTGVTDIADRDTRREEYLAGYDRGQAAAHHYRTTPMLRYGALEYGKWYWMKRRYQGNQGDPEKVMLIVYKGGNRFEYMGDEGSMEDLD